MQIEDVILGPFRRGIVYDLPFDEYCDQPAINASTLKAGFTGKTFSPMRAKWAFEHPQPDKEVWLFGRAVHCLLLEPHEFEQRYCAYDGIRNKKHHAYQDFLADHPGAEAMKLNGEYSYNSALDAAVAMATCRDVAPLIASGRAEVTLFSEFMGMQTRSRLDWIPANSGVFVDVKSTRSVTEEAFGRQFFSLHYDIQLGIYRHAIEDLTSCQWQVKCVAIENHEPYETVVYDIPDAVLDQGWERAQAAMRKVRTAIDTGSWPGVSAGGSVPLFIPTWEMEETVEWSDEE